jgi:DNA-binding transcriptional LysR family regulator
VIENRILSLTKREADVALRATRPAQGDLFGRKIASVAWTAYASRRYSKARGLPRTPEAVKEHALIGWDDPAVQVRAAEWLAENAPESAVVYRSNSLVNQLVAAREGIGIAILPCYLGDPEPGLVRAFAPVETLARELWLVTHNDLRRTARIRAFFDIVGERLLADRPLLEGRAPSSAGRASILRGAPSARTSG